jgi:hypothetical protein
MTGIFRIVRFPRSPGTVPWRESAATALYSQPLHYAGSFGSVKIGPAGRADDRTEESSFQGG